jgi:hypothetical protein
MVVSMAHWKHKSCSIPDLNVSIQRIDPDRPYFPNPMRSTPAKTSYVHYDGPSGYGPREIRTSGRGPYWHGEVTPQFASMLLRRARSRGIKVVCDGAPLAGRR